MKVLLLCNKSPFPPKEGGPMATHAILTGLLDAVITDKFKSQRCKHGFRLLTGV
jgi:hypothetical protein